MNAGRGLHLWKHFVANPLHRVTCESCLNTALFIAMLFLFHNPRVADDRAWLPLYRGWGPWEWWETGDPMTWQPSNGNLDYTGNLYCAVIEGGYWQKHSCSGSAKLLCEAKASDLSGFSTTTPSGPSGQCKQLQIK